MRAAGLPPGVSALVEDVSGEGVDLTLVNGGGADREVVVQAGAYGEHKFKALEHGLSESNAIRVSLPSGSRLSLSADRSVRERSELQVPVERVARAGV